MLCRIIPANTALLGCFATLSTLIRAAKLEKTQNKPAEATPPQLLLVTASVSRSAVISSAIVAAASATVIPAAGAAAIVRT